MVEKDGGGEDWWTIRVWEVLERWKRRVMMGGGGGGCKRVVYYFRVRAIDLKRSGRDSGRVGSGRRDVRCGGGRWGAISRDLGGPGGG